MCGIIGITKKGKSNEPIGKQIYEALTRLEYRGYDSVGMAVVSTDGISLAKDQGAIREVGKKLDFMSYEGSTAIGHSRWATHGPPNQRNAHPHKSNDGKVVVIHNGIIENFLSLKKELKEKGVEFRSDTDTEVVPNIIEQELKKGKTMEEAIDVLTSKIEGTFALVITSTTEPDKIYALRRDNPLVIGITEDAMYCASDIPAFLPWTREVIILRDDEIAVLEPGKLNIKSAKTGKVIKRRSHEVTWDAEAAQKGGFPHFMLKEIHEQRKTLATQLKTQNQIFDDAARIISDANKVVLVAAGTAHYASMTAYHTFPRYGGPVVLPCISAEWDTVAPLIDEDTVILAVSQSGETLDTIKAVKDGKSNGATVVSVVNVTGSTLTQISDLTVYIHAGPEIGVAATKTFTAQSYAVWRIAYALAKRNAALTDKELTDFEKAIINLPETVGKIVRQTEAQARDLSKWFATKSSSFYLGRGISQIAAFEGALKMKEISYIHAEGYPAGESKHGPIALVEDDYPVVFTIPSDHTRDKMMGSVQEMSARGATTIGIIEEGDQEMIEVLDHYFEIPKGYSKYLSSIAYSIPQQLLAYYTSVKRGEDPDRPRNLAKCLAPETPILMSTGDRKPIVEIYEEYKNLGNVIDSEPHETIIELHKKHRPSVIGFEGDDFTLRISEVTHLYKGKSDSLLQIQTASGREVKVTPIHKLQVLRRGINQETYATDISIGDKLLVPKDFVINQDNESIEFLNHSVPEIEVTDGGVILQKELKQIRTHFFADPIISINVLHGPFTVYDLTVPSTQKFLAGNKNMIVHNSVTVE